MTGTPNLGEKIAISIPGNCSCIALPTLVTLAVSYGCGIFYNFLDSLQLPCLFRYGCNRRF